MTTQHTDPIPLNALEIKPVAEHIDDDTASTRKHVEDPLQLKSDQDDLGAWKTLWRFRKVCSETVFYYIKVDLSY